jgi:hypothetical protein
MPARMGVSPGLYSLSNSGLMLTSMSLLRLKSVTDHPRSQMRSRLAKKWLEDIGPDRLDAGLQGGLMA